MNKRLGAVLVASTAVAASFAVTAPPAAAAVCGSYPPGQSFTLNRAPFSGAVAAGTIVGTRGTLRRGGQACSGFTLGFYTQRAGEANYRLSGRGVTSTSGSVRNSVQINKNTRFFYNLSAGAASVRSGVTQLTILTD